MLKSTAMNRKLWLLAVLLVSVHRAEAQRPTNIPRIGYISGLSPAAEQGGSCDQGTFESVPASFLYVIPHCMYWIQGVLQAGAGCDSGDCSGYACGATTGYTHRRARTARRQHDDSC